MDDKYDWGPLELLVLTYPAERLVDGAAATLEHLTGAPGVRVVDALVVRSGEAGAATAVELADLPGLRGLAADYASSGLVSEDDLPEIASVVPPGADALAVLVEHTWIAGLSDRAAGLEGSVVAAVRIPSAHAAEALAGD
ncbi:DUF6325 family protein [Paractinoplanes maris]|uniref:DUF6325 family protein n=1 Tax=Paractinoplanes maris TaxID=1734446 RepID=UPI002020C2BE|nr:DUF6325 family protein [Actinoplanes maris]